MNTKIIVTNLAVLKKKYGTAGVKKINVAIKALIAADQARGFQTSLIALDSAAAMKAVKGQRVTAAADPEQNKAAIDAIYAARVPDYILLLGAIDVIPHQDLFNPVFSAGEDDDQFAYGDLPYACQAPYSQQAKDFVGPTRVVGRLPDITGGTDPAYLLGLLKTAAGWTSRSAADYSADFAISAEVWKKSTALSVQRLFGASGTLQLVPPGGPGWSPQLMGKRAHFINCHGGQADPQFYGQQGKSNYPVAHHAAQIPGKIIEGTVAAVECCYGAELYDPQFAKGQVGIANTYLAEKAYGYFGSSTIAYGPAVGNGSADLLCQYFLRRVLGGASLGRAALEARLEFAGGAAELDPVDLKTLAQFSLLGDPSIHPVAKPVPHNVAAAPGRRGGAKGFAAAIADATTARTDRRRQLFARGQRIGATQACAVKIARPQLAGALMSALKKMAAQLAIPEPKFLSFKIETPGAARGARGLAMKAGPLARMAAPDAFHVVSGARTVPEINTRQVVTMIAKEVGGKIVSYREMHSR